MPHSKKIYQANVPFGEVQGTTPGGIPAYSNKHDHHFSGARNVEDNFFYGFKYQCVEFARRWLLSRKGLVLPDVNWAVHIFELENVTKADDATPVPVKIVRNGTGERPVADSLLIYPSTEDSIVGHVAVITEVEDYSIRVADQNHRFHKWEGNHSAELRVTHVDNGTFLVEDKDDETGKPFIPLGWVTFPDVPNRTSDSPPIKIHPSLHFQTQPAYMKRVTFLPENPKENWLDMKSPAQRQFVKTFGMDVSRSRLNESAANYYEVNQELWYKCVQTGNELHAFFLEATAEVIADDSKLELFGIPKVFWPRIRDSWETQRAAITGRFDFAFNASSQQFKCFEYNADSASTLLECAVIQEKWADSVGLTAQEHTRSAGFRVGSLLKDAWIQTGVSGRVHFLVDDDDEEQYTALYVLEKAQEAGLDTKLCVMFDNFHFDEKGNVLDDDNVPVTTVWKTWMWETAFSDYFKAKEERGENYVPKPGDKVRLCDIILSETNPSIRVFEPMWKVIPSNKAILPMIYHNHPDHPAILHSEYTLSDSLRSKGYAKKPIVGRVGRNVTITHSTGHVAAESDGNFGDRDMVYQELFDLPKQDDYYAIIGGWMIGDEFGGAGIREDKSMITGLESPFSALRIKLNFKPTPVTHHNVEQGRHRRNSRIITNQGGEPEKVEVVEEEMVVSEPEGEEDVVE